MCKLSLKLIFSIVTTIILSVLSPNTIQAVGNDTDEIHKLNKSSYELNYSNPEQAIEYALEALKLSRKVKNIKEIAASFKNIAIVYKNTGKYDEALNNCDSSEFYYEKIKNDQGLAAIYNTRGMIFYYKSDFMLALNWYQKSLAIYNKLKLPSQQATLLNNIGLSYSELRNFNKALEYYFEALKIHEKIRDDEGKAMTLANLGIIYFNMGNEDKAMEYYDKSLELRLKLKDDFGIAACYTNMGNVLIDREQFPRALEYYEKALKIFKEKKDVNNEAIVYSLIGYYNLNLGNFEQAVVYYKKALEIGEKIDNKNTVADASLNIGNALVNLGRYKEALKYLETSLENIRNIGDQFSLMYAYQAFSNYYEKTKQLTKSLEYLKKYTSIHDSLSEIESSKRISEAELLFESEKKENQIKLLNAEKKVQYLNLTKQQQLKKMLIIIAIVILLFAIFLWLRFTGKRKANKLLQEKNNLLEQKKEQIEIQKQQIEKQYQKLKELDQTKSRFFANISHEFRTPLTLIKGPLDDVQKTEKDKLNKTSIHNLNIASHNVQLLKNLIDQILDLAKLQSQKLGLKTTQTNIVAFLERTVNSFTSAISTQKKLDIAFINPGKEILLYFDQARMETVFMNLLSNAAKYIEDKGKIKVEILNDNNIIKNVSGDFIRIKISDTGVGIKKEDLPHIFNRFFRSSDSSLEQMEGTGIGLELTKEIVELHGGQIFAKSIFGEGSTFYVDLPLGKEHLSEEEIYTIDVKTQPFKEPFPQTSEKKETSNSIKNATILIAEDNTEMRQYISTHLTDYQTIEASNGQEGISLAIQYRPDLIVSDLMMPEMDGLKFLQLIRESRELSDTPFILLTARAEDEDRINGFKAKADDYMVKPFNSEELILRIKNILDTRKKLEQKYSLKVLSIDFDDENLVPVDKKFLEQLKEAVINNISDPGFGIKELSGKVFLSERQLRRKVTELSSLSPVEFIRQIRLLKAKEYLENKIYFSISEVSAAVGFNNPHYFSRLFKLMFKKSPNEIMEKKDRNGKISG